MVKTPRQKKIAQLQKDVGRLFNTTGGPPLWRKEAELRELERLEKADV